MSPHVTPTLKAVVFILQTFTEQLMSLFCKSSIYSVHTETPSQCFKTYTLWSVFIWECVSQFWKSSVLGAEENTIVEIGLKLREKDAFTNLASVVGMYIA